MEQFQLLIETSERAKSNTHRIDELAKEHAAIHELAIAVKEIAMETKSLREELSSQGSKIEALEQLPAQRWNSMVKTLVTSVATTILGGIVGAVLAVILK